MTFKDYPVKQWSATFSQPHTGWGVCGTLTCTHTHIALVAPAHVYVHSALTGGGTHLCECTRHTRRGQNALAHMCVTALKGLLVGG